MGDTDAERRRKEAEDAHRRLKEVRKRLEEAAKAKKAGGKRGFMTPERKKKLRGILKQYHARIAALEDAKYDLEYEVRQKDFVINELTIQVNDLRGKFVKPALKKVSKFDKLKMVAKSTSEVDFRSNLKAVKKEAFKLDEEKQAVKKDVPEWAAK
ncbi:hypothetical protein HPB52_000900 [Rhipicephalus sanguineus]|uniref:Troponin I n=1 Tax=Rhipicephalus sanguineus TaxID=34632 RepID=A0A9D4T146_RHISA|nr:hypothetical protein HPB52_000900 [Rhipicephalus sanguineus]